MKPILVSTHACEDIVNGEGRYSLNVYQCPITRAVIEVRDYEDQIEFTATLVEREHIIASTKSYPHSLGYRPLVESRQRVMHELIHDLYRA
jgi:hypothetical protein